MNNFDSVFGLDDRSRREANTERQDGVNVLSKGKNCLDIIKNRPEYEDIKDVIKGLGKCEAIARIRDTLAGNPRYCLVLSSDNRYFVYLYSTTNGLYNKMGPFPTLDSAMSRADCYGLFEGKKMTKKQLFERILRESKDPLEFMADDWRKNHDVEFILQDIQSYRGAEDVFNDFCDSRNLDADSDEALDMFINYLSRF